MIQAYGLHLISTVFSAINRMIKISPQGGRTSGRSCHNLAEHRCSTYSIGGFAGINAVCQHRSIGRRRNNSYQKDRFLVVQFESVGHFHWRSW